MKFNNVLDKIFKTRKTAGLDGKDHDVNDMISPDEAILLYQMIIKSKATTTLEVGMAHGVSALVFCQAIDDMGKEQGLHYAVDPNQFTDYNGAGFEAVKSAGLDKYLKIETGPSHMMIPALISQKISLDCAFIDGWHTFDYTLVDFFLVDKILKPGGYLAFHDVNGRAKQKVINFILSHRKYRIATEMMKFNPESRKKTLKFFIWRITKDPMLFFSSYHWKYQLKNSSGLVILQKLEDFEPNYDFFKNF